MLSTNQLITDDHVLTQPLVQLENGNVLADQLFVKTFGWSEKNRVINHVAWILIVDFPLRLI